MPGVGLKPLLPLNHYMDPKDPKSCFYQGRQCDTREFQGLYPVWPKLFVNHCQDNCVINFGLTYDQEPEEADPQHFNVFQDFYGALPADYAQNSDLGNFQIEYFSI